MIPNRTIREATPKDYGTLADVMFDAVRNGRSAYSEEQRQAWVPQVRSGTDWIERLNAQSIIVAEDYGRIVGFMSLAANGYIDFAYIRPSSQGVGLFRRLYRAIEDIATTSKEKRLWVHASLMAQPAFSAVGFAVTRKESIEIRGQFFQRFEMEKHLAFPETTT